jgi:hypothetical protein
MRKPRDRCRSLVTVTLTLRNTHYFSPYSLYQNTQATRDQLRSTLHPSPATSHSTAQVYTSLVPSNVTQHSSGLHFTPPQQRHTAQLRSTLHPSPATSHSTAQVYTSLVPSNVTQHVAHETISLRRTGDGHQSPVTQVYASLLPCQSL